MSKYKRIPKQRRDVFARNRYRERFNRLPSENKEKYAKQTDLDAQLAPQSAKQAKNHRSNVLRICASVHGRDEPHDNESVWPEKKVSFTKAEECPAHKS